MKIRNSVVAVVSAAIQNGVIISIDFLEPSPMCPRLEMVQWDTNPHTVFSYYLARCLTTIPKLSVEIIWKKSIIKTAPFVAILFGNILGFLEVPEYSISVVILGRDQV